ncbi:MAG: helix-turn-helix domain-containing protein [Dermatophilaceae bacterium]
MVITRWTGRETRYLRRAVRMTIAEFAHVLGVSTRTVDTWEARRDGITPRPEMQRALDTLLSRADSATQRRFGAHLTPPGGGDGLPTTMPTERSSASGTDPLPWLATTDAPERVEGGQLDDVAAYLRHLIGMDNTLGSAGLAPLAIAQFHRLRRRFEDSAAGGGHQSDIAVLLSELAEVAGWLAFDDADHEITRRMNHESLYYSDLVGEQQVKTLTLQNASMHAGFLGRPREALAIADSVLDRPGSLSPRLRSLFLVRRARALAQGGDASALRVIDEARHRHLDGVDDSDPHWVWWVDDRELSWHEGMILMDLGNPKDALRRFEHSVAVVPPGETRSRYLHLAYLLGAQCAAGAWSETDTTFERLAPLVRDVASRRTRILLSHLVPASAVHAPRSAKASFERLHRLLAATHDG